MTFDLKLSLSKTDSSGVQIRFIRFMLAMMAAIMSYRFNSNASSLLEPASSTGKVWTEHQQCTPWESITDVSFSTTMDQMLERHESTASIVDSCQQMMQEGESVLKDQQEPTSVLDLQTSPGDSLLTASISSERSFNSPSETVTAYRNSLATVAEILHQEHQGDSTFARESAGEPNATLEQDIMAWMDFMGEPTSASSMDLAVPEFQSQSATCQMLQQKLASKPVTIPHTNQQVCAMTDFGLETIVYPSIQYVTGDQEIMQTEKPGESVSFNRLEISQLLSDAPGHHQRSPSADGVSALVPMVLESLSTLPADHTQLQKYTIVPTAELLRLLSSSQHQHHQAAPISASLPKPAEMEACQSSLSRGASLPISSSSNLYSSQVVVPGGGPRGYTSRWPPCSSSAPLREPEEENRLQLVHTLLACAGAIESQDASIAKPMLASLKSNSNPCGDSMQRIALYFADALSERLAIDMASNSLTHITNSSIKILEPRKSDLEFDLAYQAYYESLPFQKFSHFTANQAILEAVADKPSVHVVDLNIRQGLQWPGFIQSLAMLPKGPPRLRITAVETNVAIARLTGKRLTEFAHSLHVPFDFDLVPEKVEHLHHGMIHMREGEILAVNCADILHSLLRTQGRLQALLCTIRRLNPMVVSLLEVDANLNMPSFRSRFVDALHYYCAIFDSLEATLDRRSAERLRIESLLFGSEIRSIVACEGASRRVRHVRAEAWQSFFRQAGFHELPLSQYATDQADMLLGLFEAAGNNMPFRLSPEFGGLSLGWKETPVMVVSSWTC